MAYIGNQADTAFTSLIKQDLTGASGTSLTLTHAVANANDIALYINNVRQEPVSAYSTNGTAVSLTGSVVSSDDIYVIYLARAIQTTVTPDGSVSTAKIADSAVSTAKIASSAVDLTSKVTGVLPVANGGSGHNAVIAFSCKRTPTSGDVTVTGDIVFNEAQVNIGSAYDTSNGRFTAPVNGTYLFSFHGVGGGASAGALPANQNVSAYFKKNGVDAGFGRFHSNRASSGYPNISGTIVITLSATDYVQVYIDSQFIYTSATTNYNQFSGHLIGA